MEYEAIGTLNMGVDYQNDKWNSDEEFWLESIIFTSRVMNIILIRKNGEETFKKLSNTDEKLCWRS